MSIRTHLTIRALAVFLVVLLAGCGNSDKPKERAIAEALAGPVTLRLRQEIHPQSKTAATVKHGDKLDVMQIRRRFVRVQHREENQGWTELRNLLSPEQMEALREQGKRAANTFARRGDGIRAAEHAHRTEPAFNEFLPDHRGHEGGCGGAQRVVPRSNATAAAGFPHIEARPPAPRKKTKTEPKVPPPPRPPAPVLPPTGVELSKSDLPAAAARASPESTRRRALASESHRWRTGVLSAQRRVKQAGCSRGIW